MSDKYKEAGVDIEAGNEAVSLMKEAVRSTFTPSVLADVGSFGGLFALDNLPERPVLVASTDGVGTKVKLAAELGQWKGIGQDIVNHCVNDILVQGARPLFFMDYIASSKLVPERVAEVVGGIAEACKAVGCALLGGETAEMPGVYAEGAFDVAGTIVGVVSRTNLLPNTLDMEAGDVLIGLPSSGPHTNGYSLIRKIVEGQDLNAPFEGDTTLGQALLAPHKSYVPDYTTLQGAGIPIKGMAHITGGGILENLPRVLPSALSAEVKLGSWNIPPLFSYIVEAAEMTTDEIYRVLNMGIGMVLVVAEGSADDVTRLLPDASVIGKLVEGTQTVILKEPGNG